MKKRSWPSIEITVAHEAADAVETVFNEMGSTGTAYSLLGNVGYDTVVVTGYFEEAPELRSVLETAERVFDEYGVDLSSIKEVHSASVEEQDWLAEWKNYWRPTVTDRFIVAAPWMDVSDSRREPILIEPGMAFGTGTHETTRLCLRAIERNFQTGMSFFDVGTGTGVLAIAAAKISGDSGASVGACDIDPEAVGIASENASINGCGWIKIEQGAISESTSPHDIVCANITLDVILPALPVLLGKTKRVLILSGILEEKRSELTEALTEYGYPDPIISHDGEWISAVVATDRD
ncbi:MAG: 50S ribosomal protein L11 methyltransferase [Acidobacteria bacterium]|nr:MAG: 50S ribosomal protein L11 methyltransferase [Acidobacteriota bacterium]REK04061.1 MAG: 50S ribosomal protein L11 methyltransferase [Acidobacteriota bacterium]REK15223.1 MAG: 50S ribosomal protein L11 methyltransferase [Acidobacteriota bacterium]REK46313.1 MAG: 50S ribosomal protein L11 methyltransferase [Acidobacteriota bacterium]